MQEDLFLMSQIFGDFLEVLPSNRDSLELNFTPASKRIKSRWRNHRLSAHFVADYLANFLPAEKEDPTAEQRVKEAKGAVSYIANELLENAMKFNLNVARHRVKFGVHFLETAEIIAVIFATNYTDLAGAKKFQEFIQKLLASDPEELYIQQIEASAVEENATMSGLGFLTMINDYQAKLGWQFEKVQSEPEFMTVTTMAQINV